MTIFKNQDQFNKIYKQSKKKIKENKISLLETTNGIQIFVRHNIYDIKIIREQFIHKQYFPVEVNKYQKPKTVLDIGGYIGDFALYCAGNLDSKVHVYEPTPQNFEILKKNYEKNIHLQHAIKIFNKGISSSNGIISIEIQEKENEIHASSHKSYEDNSKKYDIECVDLLTAINEFDTEVIDLCKIDTEGQEFTILDSVDIKCIAQKIRVLVFEHHSFVDNYENRLYNLKEKLSTSFTLLKSTKNLLFYASKYID